MRKRQHFNLRIKYMRTQRGIATTKNISHRGHRDHRDISKKQYKKRITSDKYRQNPTQKSLQNLKSLHVSSTEKNLIFELFAKVRNLPFDYLTGSQFRVNGFRLKLFSLSIRGELVEPQKNTFARGSFINNFIHFFLCKLCGSHSLFSVVKF